MDRKAPPNSIKGPRKLGTGHFLKGQGLRCKKKSKLAYIHKMQELAISVPLAAPLIVKFKHLKCTHHFIHTGCRQASFTPKMIKFTELAPPFEGLPVKSNVIKSDNYEKILQGGVIYKFCKER